MGNILRSPKLIILISIFSMVFINTGFSSTGKYWQEVEEALHNGLPKTAIESLNKILEIAQKEENYGEWITTLTKKIVIEATIQGNKPEEKVKRLKEELVNADPHIKPLLQTILAHWFWHYYSRNRYRFMRRTSTEHMIDEDFTTWDLRKLFAEIDMLYRDILKKEKLLTNIPIEKLLDFLEPGNTSIEARPTLYDFIAHEALNFYTCAEQSAVLPEDVYEIDASSAAFGSVSEFLNYKPATEDTTSPKLKAIKIYQSLIKYHEKKKNTEALFDVDLHRLRYVKNVAFGENKNKIYIQRLNKLIEQCNNLSLSSWATFYLAKAWAEEDDLLRAYEVAEHGYKRFPDSPGGKSCNAYMTELTQKSLRLTGEKCISPRPSKMLVSYKNFTRLYFRIIPDKWDAFIGKDHGYPNQIDTIRIRELLAQEPYKEWYVDLPATDDLKEKSVEIDLPELDPGYYRVFASWQPDFINSTMTQHTWLWVSNMTLVTRTGNGIASGFVLDIITGEPIKGIDVSQIIEKNRKCVYGKKTHTNSSGYFEFKIKDNYRHMWLCIKKENEKLLESDGIYVYHRNHSSHTYKRTFFFTDRSLYRPGQTINFKGICVHIDQEENNYEVIHNQEVTVFFGDASGQEIEKSILVTNEFGSFSGQFIAPADRLTGSMKIYTNEPSGGTTIKVEEYKRPKFSVEIETPKEPSKLNELIELTGRAMTYSDAPVDDALVKYNVVRTASYPYWWNWYRPHRRYGAKSQVIAHGKTKTDVDGNFVISFCAKPDPNISMDDDPRFTYRIHADVTSPDGETRSGDGSVTLGYSALAIILSIVDQAQNNEQFSIRVATQTLDGVSIPGNTTLQVYRLKEPSQPISGKFWEYDLHRFEEQRGEDEKEKFSSNWLTWPKDTLVYETSITTTADNPQTLKLKLPTGLYSLECSGHDSFGKEVEVLLPLMVLPDWNEKIFSIKLPSLVKVNNNTVEVGKELEVLWGTGYQTGRCFVEIEHDNKIIKRYWTNKNETQYTFAFPVTEKYRGGFVVHLTQVSDNRAYLNKLPIYVPWDNKELTVSAQTFRDKLRPGEKETITLKIQGKTKYIAAAEMVAAMYDFSLNQFYPHSWTSFDFFKRYYSSVSSSFINGAIGFTAWRCDWNPHYTYSPERTYIHFPAYVVQNYLYYQFPQAMVTYSKHKDFEGNYGKFIGRILDAETGEQLIGADVIIEGTDLGAATDENGHFVISYVPVGTYTVIASYISYNPLTYTDVMSAKGQITTINFRLRPTHIEVEAVACVAESPGVAITMTSTGRAVTSQEMTRLPITTINGIDYFVNGIITHQTGRDEIGDKVSAIDLKTVRIRKDLNETAFFFPHLLMNKDGSVGLEFTCPEALTKWKLMGFAHGKKCESGSITEYAITQKELMVQPNPPRFMREGDTVYFTTKVINISDTSQTGRVQLDFKDLITEANMNKNLGLTENIYTFTIEPHTSKTFSWKISIPRGMNPLSYTVVAKSKTLSDGEAGAIPILPSRIFLTESYPLHVRGESTKTFTFERLQEIKESETIESYRFTLQMTSNPTWYAIQALPYLIEFPYECSEQIFNRYYANNLAAHIANSNPRIREIFDQWCGTDALKSPLENNQDLKSVLLTETPWVVQAQNETQAKRNVGLLFEEKKLKDNLNTAFAQLKNMQLSDGSWPWFPGGKSNPYITLYITTGFGRLRHLGVQTEMSLVLRSIDFSDKWIKDIYDHIVDKSANHLSPIIAFYLYGRSFFLKEKSIPSFVQEAVNYFLKQAEQYWLTLNSRLSQGYLSLALYRFDKPEVAQKIMASIKERSVQNEEMGMFWREDEQSWWWYRAPIETQALMIEAFSEVLSDTTAVEECKIWLLKQKQTQNWKTTKATADAAYALILQGLDFLSSTKLVRVNVGQTEVTPEKIEAGTGFYEKIYLKDEILPQFSDITLVKEDKGIAWGGVYFQYFEDMAKITAYCTNLQLEKELFVNHETKQGRVIEPLIGTLNVGDLITVRVVLKVDRDMEYVHLKDLRGSGLEPVDVLSGYRYQDGLRYYQSTKDVATHFFIDYLPKGTYVFEYDLRVQLRGRYESGIAEIQCMYAPEFSSHSKSRLLIVP